MESNCAKHGLVSSKMLLTRTKSAKCTLGPGYNAADNLSVTLRTNCPFGFGLRHFAADHKIRTPFVVLIGGGQNVRHQQKEDHDCKMQTWSLVQRGGHFFRDVARNQKCILHF